MIYKGDFRQLEEALFQSIRELKADDPLAPAVVLAGSNLARLYLQRRLAEAIGSHINIRFLTFVDLARSLAEENFLCAGARELPSEGQSALCRNLSRGLSDADYFKPLSEFPGFPRALASTFTDLEDAGLAELPADAAPASLPKLESLAALYAEYQRRLAGTFYTGAELLVASAACAPRFPGIFGTDRLLVYGIYDLNTAQRALLTALSSVCQLALFVPAGYGEAGNGVVSFGAELGFPEREGNPEAGIMTESAGQAVEFISAPDPESEVCETLRSILDFVESGGNFNEVGILLRDPSYAALYADYMDRLEIPYSSSFGRPLASSPEARSLMMFLDLLARDLERFAVMEFLDYAPLDTASLDKAGYTYMPGIWDVISRKAGIVRGYDQWKRSLARQAAAFKRRCARAPEDSQAAERYEAAEGLRYMLGIIGKVASRLPAQGSWGAYIDAMDQAARSLLAPSARLELLLESMQELAGLDSLACPVILAEFGQTLKELWERIHEPLGRFQASGVNVVDLMSARGLSFPMTVLPGLVGGIFPRLPRQDPLLLDTERSRVNEKLGKEALVLKGTDQGEEGMLFRMALDSGRERVILSYARAEGAGQRERIPSPFVLETAERVAGKKMGYGGLESTPGFRRIPASPSPASSPASALSASEYDRCLARRAARAGGDVAAFQGKSVTPFWEKRVAAESAARAEELGAFYLVPGRGVPRAEVADIIGATALERYAQCPLGYFLHYVLLLSPLEEPGDTLTISALDRGDFMHAVLSSFYGELAAEGLLPVCADNLQACSSLLSEYFERELAARADDLITGLPLLWKLERERMERELQTYLAREAEDCGDMLPRHFELVFGMTGGGQAALPPAELSLDGGRKLAFRGRIDRVDVSRDGTAFRVIDYKSGKTTAKPESLEGGEQLQLPVYLLAALGLPELSSAIGLQACYVYLDERIKKPFVPYTAESASALREALASLLGTVVDLMEAGYFFVNPKEQKCKNCDYRPACPAERLSVFTRKRQDALVTSFRGLQNAG